jgi:hypothetical protein
MALMDFTGKDQVVVYGQPGRKAGMPGWTKTYQNTNRRNKEMEEMMETKVTYTVETIDRAFGLREGIPWGDAQRIEGLTERPL